MAAEEDVAQRTKLSFEQLRWICDPALLDFDTTEDVEPITNVVGAVQGRLETPFFWDEALFEATKIEPATVKVNVPSARMSYSNLLKRAFFQAKMTSALRIDDRGKAFYWISPRVKTRRPDGATRRSSAKR